MDRDLRLMCVLAHPDDESMGTGGILARYAHEGIETYLLTATGGERGWFGKEEAYPGPQELARIRHKELCEAAQVLGLREVTTLGYCDGELDQARPDEVIGKIVAHLRRVRPHVVVTFDPFGAYGHPDHIAICQFTTAAIVAAADPGHEGRGPHRVSKLYYYVETPEALVAYQEAFGELVIDVDDVTRSTRGWEPWSVTTRIDTSGYWQQVWRAIACHRSQLPGYQNLLQLPEDQRRNLFDKQSFYRAFSLVNGGRSVERDLFAGLREESNV